MPRAGRVVGVGDEDDFDRRIVAAAAAIAAKSCAPSGEAISIARARRAAVASRYTPNAKREKTAAVVGVKTKWAASSIISFEPLPNTMFSGATPARAARRARKSPAP